MKHSVQITVITGAPNQRTSSSFVLASRSEEERAALRALLPIAALRQVEDYPYDHGIVIEPDEVTWALREAAPRIATLTNPDQRKRVEAFAAHWAEHVGGPNTAAFVQRFTI